MSLLERKNSFPRITELQEHDFRREYMGSALEKKFRPEKKGAEKRGWNTLMKISDWISAIKLDKNHQKRLSKNISEGVSPAERLPTEIICQVLSNLDESSLLKCRKVNRKWNVVTDYVDKKHNIIVQKEISRLVVTGTRRGVEIRCIGYQKQTSNVITITHQQIQRKEELSFNFRLFRIHRIVIKDLSLTDELADFLRLQFKYSDVSSLVQFSLNKVDFAKSNTLTLHKLLAGLSKNIEIFEVSHCHGMRCDSITDEHLKQLNGCKLRRINIDGVRFHTMKRHQMLGVGDETLLYLSRNAHFPMIALDRCAVTTKAVCDYTENWFSHLSEAHSNMRGQICRVKRCHSVKGTDFLVECERRGLSCKHRRGSDTMILYNIADSQHNTEFTVAVDTPKPEILEREEEHLLIRSN